MERSKLIEILENGSEAELTLIQNYLLDRILKNMPTESEAIERCVENSKRVKELEDEVHRLKSILNSLFNGSKAYSDDNTTYTGYRWTTDSTATNWGSPVTVGYCQDSAKLDPTTYTTSTFTCRL